MTTSTPETRREKWLRLPQRKINFTEDEYLALCEAVRRETLREVLAWHEEQQHPDCGGCGKCLGHEDSANHWRKEVDR